MSEQVEIQTIHELLASLNFTTPVCWTIYKGKNT